MITKPKIKYILLIVSIAYLIMYLIAFIWQSWLLTAPITEMKSAFPNYYFVIYYFIKVSVPLFYVSIFYVLFFPLFQLNTYKERLFYCIVLFFCFAIIEFGLRKLSYIPGIYYQSMWFTPVENLELLHGFVGDESGITKIDTSIRQFLRTGNTNVPFHLMNYEIYGLRKDYELVKNGNISGELSDYYQKILKKNPVSRTDLDNAIIDFVDCPINEEGFKSISFKNYQASKPSVLHIGDSFTWGHNSTNKSLCFADLLLAREFPGFNTGISGTDPLQYKLIAEKWIPELKPDIVMVHFFLGNDIMKYKRPVVPNIPQYFSTNAGNLNIQQQGVFFYNPDSVCQYIITMTGIIQENAI